MKKAALVAGLSAVCLLITGCEPAKQAQKETEVSDVAVKPGLTISGARLMLPAVPGNPGAVYFTLANNGDKDTAIVAASIDGVGKTELHETKAGKMAAVKSVAVAKGSTVTFAPGGLHVSLFDLDAKMAKGDTPELTLSFADGDKLSTPVSVEAAGDHTDH